MGVSHNVIFFLLSMNQQYAATNLNTIKTQF